MKYKKEFIASVVYLFDGNAREPTEHPERTWFLQSWIPNDSDPIAAERIIK